MGDENDPLVGDGTAVKTSKLVLRDCVGCTVAAGLVCIGLVAIVLICVLQTDIRFKYGVVLDAGSSHTDLFVYKWVTENVIDGTALVEQVGHCTSSGGSISSYIHHPSQAGDSLKSCIDSTAKKTVPSYLWDRSPIYLGATAGMRLLWEKNKAVASQILNSVRKTLESSGFLFEDNYAHIISGKQEGVSAWVTVNYLLGHLLYTKLHVSGGNASDISSEHIKGALDMGGASTQIAFTPKNLTGIPSKSLQQIKLYGTKYQVYTYSYLCYGKKEAERRFLAELVKESGSSGSVDNPCGPRGFRQNVSAGFLWQPPCVGEVPSSNVSVFTFIGTGNAPLCAEKVLKLFNTFGNESSHQPAVDGTEFLAFAGYYNIIKDLRLNNSVSLEQLKVTTQELCNKTQQEVKKINAFWPMYCFDAQYIYAILTQGYHFSEKEDSITFRGSIDGRSLGWALGFMINATNILPAGTSHERVDSGVFLAVVIVGGLFIAIGILLLFLSIKRYYSVQKLKPTGRVL